MQWTQPSHIYTPAYLMAHVALAACEFNKPTLSCLIWPQSYPVQLGYMYKTKKSLTVLLWTFPHFSWSISASLHDGSSQTWQLLLLFIAGVFKWLMSPECTAKSTEGSWGISSFRTHWFPSGSLWFKGVCPAFAELNKSVWVYVKAK